MRMRTKEEVARLIEENRGWIYRVAQKLSRRRPAGMSFEDLLHETEIAFMRAAQTYDPGKSKISTYSFTTIINNVTRYLIVERRRGFTGVSDSNRRDSALDGIKILQGGMPCGKSEDDSLIDTLADQKDRKPVAWTQEQWQEILRYLPERESHILWQHLVLGKNLAEISEAQGVSRERVGQLYRRSISRIRDLIAKRVIRCEHIMEHA